MDHSLLSPDMLRSDAPPPPAFPSHLVVPPPPPPPPQAARPRAVRTVAPIDTSLAANLGAATTVATGITAVVLSLVYGCKLADRHMALPACVTMVGSWGWRTPVFDPAVSDCSAQYDRYQGDASVAGNKGFFLGAGVFVGGVIAAVVLGSLVTAATLSVQKWAHQRQLRRAVAQATAPSAGVEMV